MAAKRNATVGRRRKAGSPILSRDPEARDGAPKASHGFEPQDDALAVAPGAGQMGPRQAETIDPRMLELLVCPLTKGALHYDAAANVLISRKAQLAFPIRDGIPIMLPSEARPLEE
jgi:hypothetical protein